MGKANHSEQQTALHDYDVTARYYDLVYGEGPVPADLPFYQELADACGGPVLELGCGTGRVTLPLARAGFAVVGLDLAPLMLDQLRAKLAQEPFEVQRRVTLVQGDMTELDRPERFGLIIAPFRAFQHVLDPAAQRRCLQRVSAHLLPAGRFVYNSFNPNLTAIADSIRLPGVWRLDHETELPQGGTLRRYYMVKPHPLAQYQDLWFKYEEYDTAGELRRTGVDALSIGWQYSREAQYLLELCGLLIENAYGGYDKRPLDEKAGELIYVCRRRDEN